MLTIYKKKIHMKSFNSENYQSKGGHARARNLTPSQKSEIGKKGANIRWATPKANYEGILRIAETEIPCAVLVRGKEIKRVIVQREVVGLLTGTKKGNLDRYLNAKNLSAFVPEKFKNKTLSEAVIPLQINGRLAYCYEGEDIVDLCKMYLDARKAGGILLPNQQQLVDRAELIITSLAKTGITGLIDEATGFQAIRAKDALQAYLDKIIRKELAVWVKRFPDEFFRQIYRLKKWTWTGGNKRTPLIGKLINDIIYKRLGPGILEELQRQNPKNASGHRPATHHQWLTEDVGHPALAQHLYAIISLMKVSNTWDSFKGLVDKAFPVQKQIDQLLLPLEGA